MQGAMGKECKQDISKSIVVSSIPTKMNFGQIRSMLICLRGSRAINNNDILIKDIYIKEKLLTY